MDGIGIGLERDTEGDLILSDIFIYRKEQTETCGIQHYFWSKGKEDPFEWGEQDYLLVPKVLSEW